MPKVIVFGSINMDLSVECKRMPRPGETLTGWDFITNPGGKGANQAVAAARLGADVYMVGCVGDDAFGHELAAGLADAGVNVDCVRFSREVSTGTATIVRADGENCIVVCPGANSALGAEEVSAMVDSISEPGDVLLCQLECDLPTTGEVLVHEHERGLTTMLNAAPAHRLDPRAYRHLDVVCVNEIECEALSGVLPTDRWRQRDALEALRRLGAENAIITLGKRGSVSMAGDRQLRCDAFPVDVVDTTGAGDAFLGAIAQQVASGVPLERSLQRASAAGTLATMRVGAQQAMPTLDEVRAFLGERETSGA